MKDTKELLEIFQGEYETAKRELKYYSDLFNKQDVLYSVFFSIFAAVIGLFCFVDADQVSLFNLRLMVWPSVIFLAVTYMYFFVIMMGNSYYLIVYSEKAIIFEKLMNRCVNAEVYVWEKEFMSVIQSKDNRITKGYVNVNLIKTALVIVQYAVIQIGLGILLYSIFGLTRWFCLYAAIVIVFTIFLIFNWFKMWWQLPGYYRCQLEKLYNENLFEVFEKLQSSDADNYINS